MIVLEAGKMHKHKDLSSFKKSPIVTARYLFPAFPKCQVLPSQLTHVGPTSNALVQKCGAHLCQPKWGPVNFVTVSMMDPCWAPYETYMGSPGVSHKGKTCVCQHKQMMVISCSALTCYLICLKHLIENPWKPTVLKAHWIINCNISVKKYQSYNWCFK